MADKPRQKQTGVHWLAPTTIALSLVLGILFAVGHHLFYNSLDGTIAPNAEFDVFGSKVSRQQINIAAGTAFAFVVKVMLVTALAVAYIQLLWRALLSSKHITLGRIDVLFSGLSNVFSLAKATAWWRHPLLFILAILAWLIPVASIVTPATLSIKSSMLTHSSTQHVPNLQWVSLNYVKNMIYLQNYEMAEEPPSFGYAGPNDIVQTIVDEVAAAGSILPIPFPVANASWNLRFSGPALECKDVTGASRADIEDSIVAQRPNKASENTAVCKAYGYLAWNIGLPFVKKSSTSSLQPFYDGPMTVYVAAMPDAMILKDLGYYGSVPRACDVSLAKLKTMVSEATIVECTLLNSTYHVSFNYTNGVQDILANVEPMQDDVPQTVTYLMAGSEYFNATTWSSLSYRAIMDAFAQRLNGSIYSTSDESNSPTNVESGVLNTILTATPELQFLSQSNYYSSSSSLVASWDMGLINQASTGNAGRLVQTMEKLFQNITISMMSSQQLRPNLTSQYAPQPVNVTFSRYQSTYIYAAKTLWIAYGLAILASVIAATIGLITLKINGASYSDDFSSIFRVARGAMMIGDVKGADVDGRDPLPEYLSEAEIRFRSRKNGQYGLVEEQATKAFDIQKTSEVQQKNNK